MSGKVVYGKVRTKSSVKVKLYFSDFFKVAPKTLEDYGAFNISLLYDLPLFIDPFLLFNSEKPLYQELHADVIEYVRFLRDVSLQEGIAPGLLKSWFVFPEVRQSWLGFSSIGNRGSGLGSDFAQSLRGNLHTVFMNFGAEEITRSSHLEKLCLIKDGVGKDNISDFTTNLIKEFLLKYTEDFVTAHVDSKFRKTVPVEKVRFNYETRTWERASFDLPYFLNDFVLLTPKDILTKENPWINKIDLVQDFDQVAQSIPNEQLRGQINDYFLRTLAGTKKKPTKKETQEVASEIINTYPQILDYFIKYKEDNGELAQKVSEQRVDETEALFIKQTQEFIEQLIVDGKFYELTGDTYAEARQGVEYLKDFIENKGGHRLFYLKGKCIRRESDVQLLFKLVCSGTVSTVSSEVNDGRGPADFKISRSSWDITLTEFKLASNRSLKRNLEKQTPIYEKASDAKRTVKVIIYFTAKELEKVQAVLGELKLTGDSDIVLIDARMDNKPSGSKA